MKQILLVTREKTRDILLIGKICIGYRAVIHLPLWIRKCFWRIIVAFTYRKMLHNKFEKTFNL